MSDDDVERFQVKMQRYPVPGLDGTDATKVREWLMGTIADVFAYRGRLASSIRLVGDGFFEAADIAAVEDIGRERFLALLFKQIERPNTLRRYREGEVSLNVDGTRRRAVAVLEWGPDDQFWLAWRLVGQAKGHIGVFHGEWEQREIHGVNGITEPFDEWIDTGTASFDSLATTEVQPVKAPEILYQSGEMSGEIPGTVEDVGNLVGQLLDRELVTNGLKRLTVVAFAGRQFERFEVEGELPCALDDFLRSIAQRAGAAAIVLVHPAVVGTPTGSFRGVNYAIEAHGRRFDRTLAFRDDPDGRKVRVMTADRGPTANDCWLGVAPTTEINLFPMDPSGITVES